MDSPEQPKSKRRRNLNRRQRLFVKELVNNPEKSAKEAYMQVYDTKPNVAVNSASRLLLQPHVQESIREAIERKYPDIADKASNTLQSFMDDSNLSPRDRMAAIDRIASYMGWEAPKRSVNLKADASKVFRDLPDDKEPK